MGVASSIEARVFADAIRPREDYFFIKGRDPSDVIAIDETTLRLAREKFPENLLDKDAPTIVVTHGNAERASDAIQAYRKYFREIPVKEIIAWEYAGYGHRGNERPSEEKIYEDARNVALWIARNVGPNEKIWYVGNSLGSFPACVSVREHSRVQKKHDLRLILLSPIASILHTVSMPETFRNMLSSLNGFRNDIVVQDIVDVPILIVHGIADALVPVKNAFDLKRCNKNIKVITLPGVGHNFSRVTYSFQSNYWNTKP